MSLASHKTRWVQKCYEARNATVKALSPYEGVSFTLTEWSNRAFEAADKQWKSIYYDWREINRKFRDPDRLDLALWVNERLVALALATTRDQAVFIEIVEGDPDDDCPLAGGRLEIVLDACANYAQIRGKLELRLQPKNEKLIAHYEDVYEFKRVNVRGGTPYWCRKV